MIGLLVHNTSLKAQLGILDPLPKAKVGILKKSVTYPSVATSVEACCKEAGHWVVLAVQQLRPEITTQKLY